MYEVGVMRQLRWMAPLLLMVVAACGAGSSGGAGKDSAVGSPSAGAAGIAAPPLAGQDADEPELRGYLRRLYSVASAQPGSAELRGQLAAAYHANGFSGPAAETYGQAQALAPLDVRWPYLRALVLSDLGQSAPALEALDRAIALDPSYLPAWLWRGTWLLDLDRAADAEQAFHQVISASPDAPTLVAARVGLARSLLGQDQPDQAIELLELVTAADNHSYAIRQLRTAYRRTGQTQKLAALPASEGARPLLWPDPRLREQSRHIRGFSGRMMMANDLLESGRGREALDILEPLYETRPEDRELLNNLSIAYRLSGRNERAFDILSKGLELYPDFHLFHFNIAVQYEERGELNLALAHLDRAIELDAGLIGAYQRKLALLSRMGRYEEALNAFDAMSTVGQVDAGGHFNAGMMAGALERWPVAIKEFEASLMLDPTLARARLFLGRSLGEAGRIHEAREALMQAATMGVAESDIEAALARLRRLSGSAVSEERNP